MPIDRIDGRHRDDRHQQDRVVEVGAPVVRIVTGEAPRERRQHQQRPGRGERGEPGDRERHRDRQQLAPGLVEHGLQQAAVAADRTRVRVDALGVDGRDDHEDHEEEAQPSGQRQADGAASLPSDPEHQPDERHRDAEVLLDEQQRQRPHDHPTEAPLDVGGTGQRQQRSPERDLVEVRHHGGLQAEGEPIRNGDAASGPESEPSQGQRRDDVDGDGDQADLGDEQRLCFRGHPVRRRDEGDHRREVVTEQVESGPLDRHDRRVQ